MELNLLVKEARSHLQSNKYCNKILQSWQVLAAAPAPHVICLWRHSTKEIVKKINDLWRRKSLRTKLCCFPDSKFSIPFVKRNLVKLLNATIDLINEKLLISFFSNYSLRFSVEEKKIRPKEITPPLKPDSDFSSLSMVCSRKTKWKSFLQAREQENNYLLFPF